MRRLIVATGLGLLLSGCGLLKMNVNGKVETFGGSSSEAEERGVGNGNAKGQAEAAPSGESTGQTEQQRERAQKQGLVDARKDMLDHVAKLDKHIASQAGPVFENDVEALEKKAKSLAKAGDEDGARFARYAVSWYRMENAWRVAASATAPTLAKVLGADVVTEGDLSGKDKPVSFAFQAQAGHCYYAVSHMHKVGGDQDRLTHFRFDAGNDSPSLQRFHVGGRFPYGQGAYLYGFCALKDTQATATVQMKYAGTQNGLRYVVLGAERSAFSELVAVDLEVMQNDSCDAANWESLWTNPIPGSVIYGSEAPYMPTSTGHARELWMTAFAATGSDARLMRRDITSKPPGKLKFSTEVRFKGCPKEKENAHSPMANKIAACYGRLHAKYDAKYDAANRVLDNSRGILARARARNRIDQLNNLWDNEEQATCRPLEAQAKKEWDAAYNRIVDFYGSTPYASPIDRADDMTAQYRGAYPLRN